MGPVRFIRRVHNKGGLWSALPRRYRKVLLKLWYGLVPSSVVVRIEYRRNRGRRLNLRHPRRYNEKLQWLKVYWRDPLVYQCTDKLRVRRYVARRGWESTLNTLYGMYERVEDIDLRQLPDRFVLKPTNASSKILMCLNKGEFELEQHGPELRRWLTHNHYYATGEWNYRHLVPRIMAEAYLGDEEGNPPLDYKVFCFQGVPTYIMVDFDRFGERTRNVYDVNWQRVPVSMRFPNNPNDVPPPQSLPTMLQIAADLSRPFPQVRIDFYEVSGKPVFAECTFFHGRGYKRFKPESYDSEFGAQLALPSPTA